MNSLHGLLNCEKGGLIRLEGRV